MTIRIRPARGCTDGTRWEYSFVIVWPEGGSVRERRNAPVTGKSAARRWSEARERAVIAAGKGAYSATAAPEEPAPAVPTLAEFATSFLENHARANRQKTSTIRSKEGILRTHLIPLLGTKRLGQIDDEDVQRLKASLAAHAPKTVNNVLVVLGKLLRVAVAWKKISTVPCTIELAKVQNLVVKFYEFPEYARLTNAAAKIDARALVVILLGGDAGLRMGEMLALRWCDVDFARKQLKIERATVEGTTSTTKGNKSRIVPMTDALADALKALRHLKGELVLYTDGDDGPEACTHSTVRAWLLAAERRAGLATQAVTKLKTGKTRIFWRDSGLHKLRHTFCSHLAMRGASPKAIQELAGHENMTTTMRYMHLSPGARRSAIDLLNRREQEHGATMEQATRSEAKATKTA